LITSIIEQELKEVLHHLNVEDENPKITISNRKDLCDYQYDGAFKLAKALHKSPLEIAQKIVETWNSIYSEEKDVIIEVASPGFLNFRLQSRFINQILEKMQTSPNFAIEKPKSETYIIDYGGPNIAKPLHVGHLRSAIVGESIKRMLKFMGHKVIADVHLGDYGLQIGQVIYGLKEQGIKKEDITLKDLEEIYPRISGLCKENEEIKNKCASITKELQDGKEEYQEYFEQIKKISGDDILRIYNYLDVHFDLWYGESDAYPYINSLTELLQQENLLIDSEGAKIIEVKEATDEKEMPPFIYQKSNGAYLYSTTDLATIYERVKDYHPDHILYVTDNRQSLHFEQLFRVCKKMNLTKQISFEHLPFGTVNGKDGKPFKTRAGTAPKLDELFNETKQVFTSSNIKNQTMSEKDLDILVNAIIKFADLQNNREKDYIFDIQKFSEVIGKTGPYILYTYIRIASILKKEEQPTLKYNDEIYNENDRELRIKLLELGNTLEYAVQMRMPSIIANYLYELCVSMNAFYEINHINNLEDKIKKENWVNLLTLANDITKCLLDLLSIKIPEKM